MNSLTDYEEMVVEEMVRHDIQPNLVERALAMAGVPFEKVLTAARESQSSTLLKISKGVENGISKGLIQSIKMANNIYSTETVIEKFDERGIELEDIEDIQNLDIEDMDAVAKSYSLVNAALITAEGAAMGVATTLGEFIPFAQFAIPAIVATDVIASITLLSRNACQVAACYGFSSYDGENLPHILSSLAPEKQTSDEGYMTAKALVVNAVREAGGFMAGKAGTQITREVLEKEAPQLVRLIAVITERLGYVLTEKSLGMLVPIAGALLNGGLNLAFQQNGQMQAMDYFRRVTLERKYGESMIRERISFYAERLREEAASYAQ